MTISEKFSRAKSNAILQWHTWGKNPWIKYPVAIFVVCTGPVWALLALAVGIVMLIAALVYDVAESLFPPDKAPPPTEEELDIAIRSRCKKQ